MCLLGLRQALILLDLVQHVLAFLAPLFFGGLEELVAFLHLFVQDMFHLGLLLVFPRLDIGLVFLSIFIGIIGHYEVPVIHGFQLRG